MLCHYKSDRTHDRELLLTDPRFYELMAIGTSHQTGDRTRLVL
ncbi:MULTISPECIES: hypothetical protein [Moorena]|nr:MULTISPECIES: hypothetical protein [Moorena]